MTRSFIGATWTSADPSGLQSLVWRYYWDVTRKTRYHERLLTYNKEDCQALKLLTDKLSKINQSANNLADVDFTNQPKRHATEHGKLVHSQFETILILAFNNCEHFATYCATGKKKSTQVRKVVGGIVGVAFAVTAAVIRKKITRKQVG